MPLQITGTSITSRGFAPSGFGCQRSRRLPRAVLRRHRLHARRILRRVAVVRHAHRVDVDARVRACAGAGSTRASGPSRVPRFALFRYAPDEPATRREPARAAHLDLGEDLGEAAHVGRAVRARARARPRRASRRTTRRTRRATRTRPSPPSRSRTADRRRRGRRAPPAAARAGRRRPRATAPRRARHTRAPARPRAADPRVRRARHRSSAAASACRYIFGWTPISLRRPWRRRGDPSSRPCSARRHGSCAWSRR